MRRQRTENGACMPPKPVLVVYVPVPQSVITGCSMQVGNMETAHTFYEEGLGLLYDPSVKTGQKKGVGVSWLNIGHQQV